MVSIEAAINGGEIARVFENEEGSVIASIDDTCREHFKSYTNNIYNPHILGNDARSCFFAEHCCPEKFYHKVGCSTEPASGTLTGVVG